MKERHWTNLVSSLKHGHCVLVLGPELPAYPAGTVAVGEKGSPITYADALKRKLADELEEDGHRVSATNLAGVAQQYEDAEGFGPSTLRTQLAKFCELGPLVPSTIHGTLAELPFPLIVATCHDKLLEAALAQANKTPVAYRYNIRGDRSDNPEFAVSASVDSPIIYRLFGAFEDPQSLVISEDDLLEFLIAVVSERPPMPNSFRRALQRPDLSLLFVGFGIRHWYLRVLLKALVRALTPPRSANAVALEPLLHDVPDYDRQQTVLFYQRGTRIEIRDDDIQSFVAELRNRLLAEGGPVEHKLSVGPTPRVFVSYASEDSALASRLFATLQDAGFRPWLDKDALRGGDDWNQLIEDELREADYVLVLATPALAEKRVGYVNKEISIARDKARHYRGAFLIPLLASGMGPEHLIEELASYQSVPLRDESFDKDAAVLVSTMRRDYQRRNR
jgi:hypothetical protein